MGEAKRRKETDILYGKYPKKGKGIVISQPLKVVGGGVQSEGQLDPIELRRAILFWDELVWPKNNFFHVDGGIESDFLEAEGLLSRPHQNIPSGNVDGSVLGKLHVAAFERLNNLEPGRWVLSQGERSFLWDQGVVNHGRGAVLSLMEAIPLPDADVPLEEVLEFKRRYKDELYALKQEIDKFYSDIESSGDSEYVLRNKVEEIDRRCADIVKVAKEQRFPNRLSSLSLEYSLPVGAILAVMWPAIDKGTLQLPGVSDAIGGVASALVTELGMGLKKDQAHANPFRVVGKMHTLLSG
ncbi:MAG: DUF6236 family protein [Limimaricola soesokkakensis]|uniref:DUF6236 family protein n=1 Tax=Limimaricola soesokkakensis TaxID=1343159 RepID=UPI00405828D5